MTSLLETGAEIEGTATTAGKVTLKKDTEEVKGKWTELQDKLNASHKVCKDRLEGIISPGFFKLFVPLATQISLTRPKAEKKVTEAIEG